eukprot:TRINITY_DN20914_c0_g1_i1.p1 TRINITY_DN20914_c0_g1~~TRINITY_DN20914_c0_g1_i1.p1  ORF type:complete len:351 (-),score=63.65 TRINITY_DN20914_c0_g1_i1:320-1372(-)
MNQKMLTMELILAMLLVGLRSGHSLHIPRKTDPTPPQAAATSTASNLKFGSLSATVSASDLQKLESACAEGASRDSFLLSGFFVLKQVAPATFASMGLSKKVEKLMRRNKGVLNQQNRSFLGVQPEACLSIYSSRFMEQVDLWYFSAVDSSFAPSSAIASPNDVWMNCALSQLPGGSASKKPERALEYLVRFINANELAQAGRASPDSKLAKAAASAASEADAFFQGDRCEAKAEESSYCGYHYTHRLLMMTRLLTQKPLEEDKKEVARFTGLLKSFIIPYLRAQKRVNGDLDVGALDLIAEVAFVLKGVAGASNDDSVVSELVQTLKGSKYPLHECHPAVTYFLATSGV